ncbi:urease accessory protein UreE [Flavobacterium granuli]|uniref:Urease accessory protein UreE n=1 Tax=Flavobacterium granuli TaxID=280093 RepID=A0A1M5S0H8_9FLAO|nr:urease accessory protein UreE [Flavobacterium granuli]PRZ21154.1 urease accessory protein [Flavobacterium granuli]SHH31543.1 urease accessory protein [Flavobacterium granuli]
MIIQQIIGNTQTQSIEGLEIDLLEIEWFEATKRIQRRRTNSGMEIAIKFIQEGQRLHQDDILYQDDKKVVVVHIKPCEAIVMTPASLLEMGTICYEIGNKHLPLFIQNDQIMMPFEMPMFRWLEASGYSPEKQEIQLLHLLKSNVAPHGHGSTSLFTKILNIAASND